MPIAITIRTRGIETTVKTLSRIHKKTPELTSSAMMQWGKILERDLKHSARLANISKFTGELTSPGGRGIQYRQRPKGRVGRLFIRLYGILLDSMRPHWVNITPSRTRFLMWSQQAKDPLLRNAGTLLASGTIKKKAIFVRPHPFIRSGYRRARPKLSPILRNEMKKAVGRTTA